MNVMVVDTSVLLAIFFKEKQVFWAKSQLRTYQGSLQMSTVNLAEVLILLRDRQPKLFEQLKKEVFALPIRFVPPTTTQAEICARARLQFPSLNLGDCFAYALAKEKSSPILTLDQDFKKADLQVFLPPE